MTTGQVCWGGKRRRKRTRPLPAHTLTGLPPASGRSPIGRLHNARMTPGRAQVLGRARLPPSRIAYNPAGEGEAPAEPWEAPEAVRDLLAGLPTECVEIIPIHAPSEVV